MNKTTRILVVDDEPEVLRVFTLILNAAGYEVLEASTGQHGLQLAREQHPDLVLLDVLLPDLDGMDVCKQIKADAALRDVLVVLISGGATNAAHKVQGLESGADDYIAKPVDRDELLVRIRTMVRLRDATTALRTSEQHYRRLVEILPEAVTLIDLQGRVLSVNRQAVSALGYADEAHLLNKSVFDLTPREDHERIKADIATTLQNGVIQNFQYTMFKENGNRFPVELSAAVSTDASGRPVGLVTVGRDITQRKQAEKRVRHLLNLLDQAHDAIIVRDLEGRIQYFNEGARRLLGWTADEIRGRRAAELFFNDNSECDAAEEKLLQSGEWSGELRVNTKARRPVIVHSRWTLVRDETDQSASVVCINTDVTEHKRAEEALKESEARYRDLVENQGEGLGLVDTHERFTFLNPAGAEIFGASAANLVGRALGEFMTPDQYARVLEQTKKRRAGERSTYELEIIRPDGETRWLLVTGVPRINEAGRFIGTFGIFRDITERKRVDEALLASEERFRQLAENINEVFWISDPAKKQMIYISPGYEDIWGRTCESLYDSPRDWVEALHPDDRERVLEAALTKQVSGQYDEVYRIVRPGGSIRWIHDRAFPVKDPSGAIYRIVGIAEDITGRKHVEEALRQSQERYRSLAEASPDAIFILDRASVIQYVNGTATRWLGKTDAEVQGHSRAEFFPPNVARAHGEVLRRVFEKGELVRTEGLQPLPGGERWIETRLVPLRNQHGVVESLMGIGRDLTEEKRAQTQLLMLAHAVESTTDPICITDLHNRFTFVNSAFQTIYGYTQAEILGKTPEILNSRNNPPSLMGEILEQSHSGGWRGELLDRRKDGTEFPVFLSTSQIKDPTGRVFGLMGVAQDITERKRAERQRTAFSRLGHRLSAVVTPHHAAQVILEITSELFNWNAGCIHLYSQTEDKIVPLLAVGSAGGQRMPIAPARLIPDPPSLLRRVTKEGALLISRENELSGSVNPDPPGDADHRSVSEMHVPIHSSGEILGILSIGSLMPKAYSRDDLQLLQSVADHCGVTLERIKVALTLSEVEASYRSVFENATEGIFRTTPEGRILIANPALARMFRYPSPQEMISSVTDIGRQVYVSAEKRAEMKRALEEQGSVQGFEEENIRKDGSIIWVSLNAHTVRDASGAVQYFEGTIQDITERKWAEKFLQVQRDFGIFLSSSIDLNATAVQLLQIALQNEGVDCGGVFLADPDTGALDLAAHQGFSADFAKRASHFDADSAQGRPAGRGRKTTHEPGGPLAGIVDQLKREGLLAMELLPVQHRGEVVAVLSVGSHVRREIPAKSRQALEVIAARAAGAITRIRVEQSLRANRRLLQRTLHSLPSAVLVVKADTNVIEECNPATTQMFGYTRDELIGRTTAFLHVDHAMRRQFADQLRSAVEVKGFLSDFEFRMRRKGGMVFPTEHSMMPIRNEVGLLVSWVSVVQDITDRKRAEEELRQLPRRIIEAQETERLRVAREMHDGVNQVIASVKMRLRQVESRVETLNPAAREILARCDKLLVQALEENRRIAHNLRPSDLDELGLAAACRNFCKEIQARTNLTVQCNIERLKQRLPQAVELNLFRIMQESITNVEKHAHAKTVQLRLSLQGDSVVLRIQDDGRGFAPQRSRAGKGKWRGIGLTNMRERALSLGGACEVLSAPRKGTTISVRIPCNHAG